MQVQYLTFARYVFDSGKQLLFKVKETTKRDQLRLVINQCDSNKCSVSHMLLLRPGDLCAIFIEAASDVLPGPWHFVSRICPFMK